MKLLALTLLLSMAAEASRPYPLALPRGCRDRGCVRERVITPYVPAYFEFAPASGAGMGAACACSTPTGAKGEAMTFTRASSATCLVRSTVTGIQNGDMKTCATNQPRVRPTYGDGSGPLGVLIEPTRSNVLFYSQAVDNAAWANFVAGNGTNPVRGAADTDVAPDGTTTAEQVTFGSTLADAGDSSGLSQTVLTAALWNGSLFARDTASVLGADGGNVDGGNVGGTFDLCLDANDAGTTCAPCGYVVGSWSWCADQNVTSKASGKYYIGNLSSLNGGTRRPQQTVTLWGQQAEADARGWSSSYIPTLDGGSTRSVDVGYVTASLPVSSTWSIAVTTSTPANLLVAPVYGVTVAPGTATSNRYKVMAVTSAQETLVIQIGGSVVLSGAGTAPNAVANASTYRFAGSYDGNTTTNICLNGTCTTAAVTAFTPLSGSQRFYLNASNSSTGSEAGTVISQVCYDPTLLRCN